eukprot:g34709.t1
MRPPLHSLMRMRAHSFMRRPHQENVLDSASDLWVDIFQGGLQDTQQHTVAKQRLIVKFGIHEDGLNQDLGRKRKVKLEMRMLVFKYGGIKENFTYQLIWKLEGILVRVVVTVWQSFDVASASC